MDILRYILAAEGTTIDWGKILPPAVQGRKTRGDAVMGIGGSFVDQRRLLTIDRGLST